MHDIHECSEEEVITTWMTDVLSLSGELCVWVIGLGNGGGGVGVGGSIGGVCRTYIACRDAAQPRFGHIISSSCRPQSDYLAVPDVRKKCYKIPPENELCLCEDIFQQHQAKLVNCDVEDAIAVESYKDPSDFDVCDDDGGVRGASGNECCCGDDDDDGVNSSKSSLSSSSSPLSSAGGGRLEDSRKSSDVLSVPVASADTALEIFGGSGNGQLSDKLTAEERHRVLQELDDIVTGNFLSKVRRFSQDVQSDYSDDHRRGSDNQQIQLTTTAAARLCGKRSSSLDTDEIVNYGKVAELTRRFSRLGEASIITPQHYCSEPNFFRESETSVSHYRHNNNNENSSSIDGSSGDDYEVVRQPIRMVFIRPMSVSDNRLNRSADTGGSSSVGGVVLTEVTSDGENDVAQRLLLNATQTRRQSFRKSLAFDSSLSSIVGAGDSGGDETAATEAMYRYQRLKGGWQSMAAATMTTTNYDDNWLPERRTTINYSKSSDTVSVSNLDRSHRRYSSVDVYDQVKHMFLDVEKTEKEFRDHLLAEKHRRHEAIQEYLANKELLLMKMKSASTGGILRWNQEHQDTLLDDEDSSSWPPQTSPLRMRFTNQSSQFSTSDEDDESSHKDMLRRVLHTGLKGRRIRKLRKLESRSSGFARADLWRISNDEPPSSSSRHSTGCSSAEPLDNHNNTL